ncbi:MAG TPA: lysophospholipid acyltransferase family protein [Woeseiaceae bacterium]|nr:lysophospholipid acyltransferase family protein [Woeseiaceae bacterium]
MRRLLHALFGLYAIFVFALCVLFSLFVAVLVPGLERRRRLVAGAARASFLLSGVRPEINGLENLPVEGCVVVANHASYVDGILLKGFLPARFSFVIKGEMRDVPIAHFLMRRSGARFVERFKSTESSRDARQIMKAARSGESLGFFPEGTFLAEPGVGRFRAGAFMAAIKGGMPVVPIAISGTREMLGADRTLPRPAPIRVDILPPILPDDAAYGNHHSLAEAARQRILAVLDEPDLLATLG